MTDLRNLQHNFISDCLSSDLTDDNVSMTPDLNTETISARGRMGIYRESILGNITLAMQLTYPVVERLVGEDFFRATCRKYIERYWPTGGDMDDYGAEFSDFLDNFEPAKSLPYLPDTARLEWLFHNSSVADDGEVVKPDSLEKYTPEQLSDLCFRFHPSVNFFSSPYPVHKIWEANQDNADSNESIDLSQESGSNLMLTRTGLKVNIIALPEDEYIFTKNLYYGNTLSDAFEAAAQLNKSFDMQALLVRIIALEALSATYATGDSK